MKTRLTIIAFAICSLFAATASGQRATRIFQLQDDESGAHFTFDSSGNYSYWNCQDGTKLQGAGNLKISGCTVTLDALTRMRLVQAEVDLCKRVGKASVIVESSCPNTEDCGAQQWTVADANTGNNTPDCK